MGSTTLATDVYPPVAAEEINVFKLNTLNSRSAEERMCAYKVEEIAQILAISSRAAYNLCKSTKDFKVIRIGKSVRVNKQSFDNWLASA